MPDREKVEEWERDFKAYVDELDMARDVYRGIMEYIDDALALLREQEPVKPKRFLGALSDWYHCGVCWADMLDTGDGYRPKYCPQCGRAVEWE